MLERSIDNLARSPRLLVACSFDGVIAPFASSPDAAEPLQDILEGVRALSRLPDTWAAVVGGRSLDDLRARIGEVGALWLVGLHGAEIAGPGLERRASDLRTELDLILRLASRVAPTSRGFVHERKPASVAVHFRNVEPAEVHRVIPMLTYALAVPAGLRVKRGAMVVEYMAIEADLGRSVELARCAVAATDVAWITASQEEMAFHSTSSHFLAMSTRGAADDGKTAAVRPPSMSVEAPSAASPQDTLLELLAARERVVGNAARPHG